MYENIIGYKVFDGMEIAGVDYDINFNPFDGSKAIHLSTREYTTLSIIHHPAADPPFSVVEVEEVIRSLVLVKKKITDQDIWILLESAVQVYLNENEWSKKSRPYRSRILRT